MGLFDGLPNQANLEFQFKMLVSALIDLAEELVESGEYLEILEEKEAKDEKRD